MRDGTSIYGTPLSIADCRYFILHTYVYLTTDVCTEWTPLTRIRSSPRTVIQQVIKGVYKLAHLTILYVHDTGNSFISQLYFLIVFRAFSTCRRFNLYTSVSIYHNRLLDRDKYLIEIQ